MTSGTGELAEAHRHLWAMIAAVLTDDGPGLRALAADLAPDTARTVATAGAVALAEMLTNPEMPAMPMPPGEALAQVRHLLILITPTDPPTPPPTRQDNRP
ncbi:hypothetical protein [Actinomadura macra]|uniref:hypothetical protein n=1 Tax=Actinomadura macra TaxID=46164 RepID=UPI000A5C839C|nr:hypothetical protein [Actinomadura macra]